MGLTIAIMCAVTIIMAGRIVAQPADARLRGVHYLSDLPTMVAEHHGLFAAEGVDIEVGYGLAGQTNLQALRAGAIDFALMALTPLVIDRLRDPTPGKPGDPVMLANLAHANRLNHVVTLDPDKAEPRAALAGAKVGLMKGTNAEFVWSLFAAHHGLARTDTEVVDLATDAIPDALAAGQVTGAVVWQPWTDRLRQRFGERLQVFPSSTVYTGKWVLVSRRETVAKRPDLCGSVLRAYQAALQRIQRDPEATRRLYNERAGVAVADKRYADTLIYELSLDWSILSTLLEQGDWARRAGYGSGPFNPLELLAPGPLRAVAPATVHVPEVPQAETEADP